MNVNKTALTKWTKEDQDNQNLHLQRILDRIRVKTKRQASSVVIFDLDGTLYDNRPRTMYIFRQIADQFYDQMPQLVKAVENGEIKLAKAEWAKRFFTDYYQQYDVPLPGAKKFVCDVYEAGATVIYLTGRDVNMLVGLTQTLRMCGFPVGVVGTMTMTKKDFNQDDGMFKDEVAAYLDRLGEVVGIFENEPANSNLFQKNFPGATSMFLLTQHRPDAPELDDGITPIRDFRIL